MEASSSVDGSTYPCTIVAAPSCQSESTFGARRAALERALTVCERRVHVSASWPSWKHWVRLRSDCMTMRAPRETPGGSSRSAACPMDAGAVRRVNRGGEASGSTAGKTSQLTIYPCWFTDERWWSLQALQADCGRSSSAIGATEGAGVLRRR